MKHALALILCAGVAACSTTPYQQPVSQVAAGLASVKTTMANLESQRRDVLSNELTLRMMAHGAVLHDPSTCLVSAPSSGADQTNCLYEVAYSGGQRAQAIDITDPAPKGMRLAEGLDKYGQGINALAQAQDIADLQKGAAAAGAGIAQVANVINPAAGVAVNATVEAATWLFGRISDALRLQTLTTIVCQADPYVQDAKVLLAGEARKLQESVLLGRGVQIDAEYLNWTRQTGDEAARQKGAAQLINDAMDRRSLAGTDVAAPITKMADAHQKLCQSLKGSKVTIDEAITSATIFAGEAARVATIVNGKSGSK